MVLDADLVLDFRLRDRMVDEPQPRQKIVPPKIILADWHANC